MARLIRTEKEVEGRFEEVWLVVEEDPLTQWPSGPQAVVGRDAVQCGFCTPGQVVSAAALVADNPSPTVEEIRHRMAGNICRCGTYPKIEEAILSWQD